MRQNTANQAEDTSQEQASGGRSWTETEDLCRKTLDFCAEKGLSPVPPIYELVFKYFEGKREDIVAGLGEALERGPVQSFQLLELHDRYLGNDDLAIAFGTIGTNLGNELGSLEQITSTGQEDAIRSRGELTRLVSGLHSHPSTSDMSSLAQRMRDIVLQQSRNVSDMKEGLDDARGRLSKIERELETYVRQANTDFLTSLPNRRALDAKLSNLFSKPYRPGMHDTLLMIDIDWFKTVNDSHGHEVGDNVLREFSSILKNECQKVDAYPGRWGGEEFCVIHSCKFPGTGLKLAEEIRTRFEGLNWKRMSDGVDIGKITVSVGLARRTEDSDPATLATQADQALYAAKDAGRNRCVEYAPPS